MIAYVTGTVVEKDDASVVLDVQGVGYRVFVTATTLAHLAGVGNKAALHTHLYVREDQLSLYGFVAREERALFTLLLGVSGVGPKGALRILSAASLDKIRAAIAAGETAFLTKVSGIGPKTAQKLILELREKMKIKGTAPAVLREDEDAVDALIALGYSLREARDAVERVAATAKGVEGKVTHALKMLGAKK